MRSLIRPSIAMLLCMTVLTGVLYPLAVTAVARAVFPGKAKGSLIVKDGHVLGSSLIGQPFSEPKYFWSRPSATTPAYNPGSSSGSNLGPTNPALTERIEGDLKRVKEADPQNTAPIPIDLLTSSASGLDPHISPAAANYQAARVARVRGMDVADVQRLIANHTEGRTFGILGESRVNVLELNLDLDSRENGAASR